MMSIPIGAEDARHCACAIDLALSRYMLRNVWALRRRRRGIVRSFHAFALGRRTELVLKNPGITRLDLLIIILSMCVYSVGCTRTDVVFSIPN